MMSKLGLLMMMLVGAGLLPSSDAGPAAYGVCQVGLQMAR